MKVLLIGPSNTLYMPYLDNYTRILKENSIEYSIIIWDRFGIENNEHNKIIYRDKKLGHKRNLSDYYSFSTFVKKEIKKIGAEKIIVFGLQIFFFLHRLLDKFYKDRYMLDIRDYHRLINFIPRKIFSRIKNIVISSAGYKEWLPEDNLILNHNSKIKMDEITTNINVDFGIKPIKILCIGALRDYEINEKIIHSLGNNKKYELIFRGEGTINNQLSDLIISNNYHNVILSGRYEQKEEKAFYIESSFINVLRSAKDINNNTALPNRLYQAVEKGIPLLAYKGTYLSKIIHNYKLGLVLYDLTTIDKQIEEYIRNFDILKYNENRKIFLAKTLDDNNLFKDTILNFSESKEQ
ncbi:hypothetical protein MKX73_12515 [Solibacillus sp. FSL W7-1436]|uniref:hypothetical protein n=1 Tax=Solibacillus sp. FSL W7-1436 TaxID=2921705 RepID=UPI0030F691DA